MERRHGTVAVLALLLSVLFSAVDVRAGRVGGEPGSPSVGRTDSAKSGIAPRSASRNQDDERALDGPPLAARGARVETALMVVRAIPAAQTVDLAPRPPRRAASYRARAPPAAA